MGGSIESLVRAGDCAETRAGIHHHFLSLLLLRLVKPITTSQTSFSVHLNNVHRSTNIPLHLLLHLVCISSSTRTKKKNIVANNNDDKSMTGGLRK